MRHALPEALLAAVLTALLVTPIFGLRIQVDGVNVSLSHNPTPVIIAVIFVFLLRLFREPLARAWATFHIPASWRDNPLTTALGRMQQQPRYQTGLWALLLIAAVIWPFTASRGAVDVMTLALIYVMLGLGLNIVVGFAGLLVLGYAAFYAVGAYTYALLAQHYGLSFWLCLPISAALAAWTGFLLGLPVLRLRGDYLAIVTLGFGEITRLLLNNLNFLTGGPDGISVPALGIAGLAAAVMAAAAVGWVATVVGGTAAWTASSAGSKAINSIDTQLWPVVSLRPSGQQIRTHCPSLLMAMIWNCSPCLA